jgi:hypothetical protein
MSNKKGAGNAPFGDRDFDLFIVVNKSMDRFNYGLNIIGI